MKRSWLITAAAAPALALSAFGIAQASIPDSGGVIHGCYKRNSNGSNAPLGVIDRRDRQDRRALREHRDQQDRQAQTASQASTW